ncbi:MAG: hypothetical protein ACYS26_12235 [Planctomycetota bacterium]|jgi:hypothetical protein
MPKLIVADGGQKKAFKLSKGRLTLGSGEGDKLKLSGSEPGHAVLVIDADGGTLDANAEVTIDGAGQSGSGLRLEFGSKLKIGGAVLMLTADEDAAAAPQKAAPKAGAKKRAAAPAAGAARSSARGGSSRGGSQRGGGRASAAKSGGAARGRSGGRRGGSSEQKQGLPGWAVPTIVVLLLVGVGGAWMAFGGGGNVGNYLAAAEVGLDTGDYAKVENSLSSIDEDRLGGTQRAKYNELKERFDKLKRDRELAPRRNAGFKWIGEKLESFADRYIDKKDSIPAGPARVFLERVEEFKTLWPEHNDPVWTENADGKKKLDFIADRVRKYEAVTRLGDPITYEELAWAHEYYMANQNFRVLMPKLRGFLENSPDELDASLAQGLLESAKLGEKAFVDEFLGKAKEEFEKYQQGGETFPMRTASKLHAIVLRADDPQMRSDAVNRFLGLPGIEEILQAYDKNAAGTFAGLLQESLIAAKWEIVKKNKDAAE